MWVDCRMHLHRLAAKLSLVRIAWPGCEEDYLTRKRIITVHVRVRNVEVYDYTLHYHQLDVNWAAPSPSFIHSFTPLPTSPFLPHSLSLLSPSTPISPSILLFLCSLSLYTFFSLPSLPLSLLLFLILSLPLSPSSTLSFYSCFSFPLSTFPLSLFPSFSPFLSLPRLIL